MWRAKTATKRDIPAGPCRSPSKAFGCLAVLTLRNLVVTGIDRQNAGQAVAVYPWTTDFANNIATPAVVGDSVIITSAYNHSAICRLRITLGGATKAWETKGIASGVCSPIIHDGRVYWAWRGVHCVDFDTGVELWTGGKVASQGSCIMASDERLIVYSNKGELSLVDTAKRSPKKYSELAAQTVFSKTDAWPHVVLSGGRILCRDRGGSVRCLEVSAKLSSSSN